MVSICYIEFSARTLRVGWTDFLLYSILLVLNWYAWGLSCNLCSMEVLSCGYIRNKWQCGGVSSIATFSVVVDAAAEVLCGLWKGLMHLKFLSWSVVYIFRYIYLTPISNGGHQKFTQQMKSSHAAKTYFCNFLGYVFFSSKSTSMCLESFAEVVNRYTLF